ncbi:hypothetical protein PR003_g515 [Phytophthora rubi]|uniref:Tetratrico peptide repeat group 5 domain-containing protein n=1 Tax=Phytophthora rubi TaxID=129364 RepID=A0A6A4G484_9STRA|nr:hypothetical protein PR003_g515 [Phytophthora rubi]
MRLYVHLEPAEEALAWTKRLNLPPVGDASACPSVRSVLRCFLSAYASKFRLQCVPDVDSLDVFVEMNQNAASRRLLPCLDVSVAAAGNTETHSLLNSRETCDFELVAVPPESQRPVLGPEPPPSKKKCPVHAETSSEDGRVPKLRAALQLAANHMQQSKFRAARDVYSHVVLAEDALNPEALVALGDILVANGRRDEAVDKFFSKCWKAHGGVESECKAHARLAFTSALRLAECYVEMEKFWKAVEVLDELQTFVRVNSGKLVEGEGRHKAFFRDADERLWMEEQMDVLKAQALYATKRPDEQEKAISLIMHLLPDLQAPTLNLDALLLYAKIAHDRGKKSEALSMALRVLVGKSNDRRVKRTLVAFLKDSSSMQRLQDAVPTTSASAGAAYAFIATILKDFGAVEKSIVCFQQAQLSDPQRILDAVEKCKYESIKEGMEHTIAIFMEALADVVGKYEFEAYIHPVVPVLDETRALVIQYNQLFRKHVAQSTICKWLDFFDDLVCDNPPKLRPDLRLDGTHLHPAYLVNLEKALNKQCHASS